jgi:hypothetical protein
MSRAGSEKAGRLERRVARRNLREYMAAVVVVFACGWTLWSGPSASARISAGLIIAGDLSLPLASCSRRRRLSQSILERKARWTFFACSSAATRSPAQRLAVVLLPFVPESRAEDQGGLLRSRHARRDVALAF